MRRSRSAYCITASFVRPRKHLSRCRLWTATSRLRMPSYTTIDAFFSAMNSAGSIWAPRNDASSDFFGVGVDADAEEVAARVVPRRPDRPRGVHRGEEGVNGGVRGHPQARGGRPQPAPRQVLPRPHEGGGDAVRGPAAAHPPRRRLAALQRVLHADLLGGQRGDPQLEPALARVPGPEQQPHHVREGPQRDGVVPVVRVEEQLRLPELRQEEGRPLPGPTQREQRGQLRREHEQSLQLPGARRSLRRARRASAHLHGAAQGVLQEDVPALPRLQEARGGHPRVHHRGPRPHGDAPRAHALLPRGQDPAHGQASAALAALQPHRRARHEAHRHDHPQDDEAREPRHGLEQHGRRGRPGAHRQRRALHQAEHRLQHHPARGVRAAAGRHLQAAPGVRGGPGALHHRRHAAAGRAAEGKHHRGPARRRPRRRKDRGPLLRVPRHGPVPRQVLPQHLHGAHAPPAEQLHRSHARLQGPVPRPRAPRGAQAPRRQQRPLRPNRNVVPRRREGLRPGLPAQRPRARQRARLQSAGQDRHQGHEKGEERFFLGSDRASTWTRRGRRRP
mmetsp:Transcript_8920/g.25899  ORF Transcript_8920/g.25899 Transcript_8920/m.25899 type:complete len:562 (-) Transcript_8920:365-2050(-)